MSALNWPIHLNLLNHFLEKILLTSQLNFNCVFIFQDYFVAQSQRFKFLSLLDLFRVECAPFFLVNLKAFFCLPKQILHLRYLRLLSLDCGKWSQFLLLVVNWLLKSFYCLNKRCLLLFGKSEISFWPSNQMFNFCSFLQKTRMEIATFLISAEESVFILKHAFYAGSLTKFSKVLGFNLSDVGT